MGVLPRIDMSQYYCTDNFDRFDFYSDLSIVALNLVLYLKTLRFKVNELERDRKNIDLMKGIGLVISSCGCAMQNLIDEGLLDVDTNEGGGDECDRFKQWAKSH